MYFDPMCNEMAVVTLLIITDTLAGDSSKAFAVSSTCHHQKGSKESEPLVFLPLLEHA